MTAAHEPTVALETPEAMASRLTPPSAPLANGVDLHFVCAAAIREDRSAIAALRGEKRAGEERAPFLRELVQIGLKRKVNPREAITIGPCECGD